MSNELLLQLSRRGLLAGGMMGVGGALLGGFDPLGAAGLAGHGMSGHAHGCRICNELAGAPAQRGAARPRAAALLAQRSTKAPPGGGRPAKASATLILQPDWVLAFENGKLKLLADHEVVVRDDRILDVRPHSAGSDDRIRLPGQILTPSFISGHTHSCAGTLTRGYIEETPIASIQGEGSAPRARSLLVPMTMIDDLSEEELDDLTAINLAEMLRTGCTTQIDMSLSLKQMQSYVRVATRFGMRGYPGGMVPGMKRLLPIWTRTDNKVLADSEAATLAEIAACLDYSRTVNGSADGRIRPMMAPSVVATHTRASFAAIINAAQELGNGVHIHIQNSWRPRDMALLKSYWNMGEVEILREVGLLDGTLFGGHMLGIDVARDLPILAQAKRFTFAHCPSGAGWGTLPSSQCWPEALAAGVNTSIGLDTHSNDYLDNIRQAVAQGRSRAQLLAKTSPVPLVEPTIWHAMEAATVGAARGLGRDDLGRIQAGAKADLCTIMIDGLLSGSGTRPIEPLNNLLYTNGLAVRNVMTDGQWQLRDGQLLVGDEADLVQKGGVVVAKIWNRLKDQGYFEVGGHRD